MSRYSFTFFYFLFLCCFQLSAQTQRIDSLKRQIAVAKSADNKLDALFAIGEERHSLSTDILCNYANEAKNLSIKQGNILNIAIAEYNIGACLVKKGMLDSALKLANYTIEKIKSYPNNDFALMKLTLLKGQVLIRSTKYKEGIAEIYKLLAYAEQNQDTLMQMIAKNGIGWANMEMQQTSEALRWFFKALNTSTNQVHHEKSSNIYSNIAAVYRQLHKNDSAEFFINKAIVFARKSQNLMFLANCLNILADIYIDTKRAILAESLLTNALNIRKQIGDPFYVVSDLSQLALYYASISEPAKGIEVSQQGIAIANEYRMSSKLPFLYHALGQNYKAAGNYTAYSNTLEKIMALKDSMYVANSAEAKAEMDSKYEVEKKEKLIALQKLDISKKNFMFYASVLFLFFSSLVGWMLFRGYKKSQQIKLLKMQAEEKQLAARAVLSAEEKERKRISRDLHDNIGAYATALMANTEELKKQASGETIRRSADNVSHNAQNIMGSLQETIWVLNNDVITITDFLDRYKIYSKKMLQQFPGLHIRFKEDVEKDFELSPQEALHIFRIMQEALQNTLKHAQAKNIIVTVKSADTVSISIKDDGKGFNENRGKDGNGLLNMQHRAKEAGYHINILSDESGTEITVEKNHSFAVL